MADPNAKFRKRRPKMPLWARVFAYGASLTVLGIILSLLGIRGALAIVGFGMLLNCAGVMGAISPERLECFGWPDLEKWNSIVTTSGGADPTPLSSLVVMWATTKLGPLSVALPWMGEMELLEDGRRVGTFHPLPLAEQIKLSFRGGKPGLLGSTDIGDLRYDFYRQDRSVGFPNTAIDLWIEHRGTRLASAVIYGHRAEVFFEARAWKGTSKGGLFRNTYQVYEKERQIGQLRSKMSPPSMTVELPGDIPIFVRHFFHCIQYYLGQSWGNM